MDKDFDIFHVAETINVPHGDHDDDIQKMYSIQIYTLTYNLYAAKNHNH